MLNKIRDFICRYRFWVYLGGFILLIIGASLAGWVSSYFLIVVVVGLIAIAGSILVKNKEEKDRPKGNVIEGAKTSESHLENTNQGIYTLKNDTQYNPDQAALPISNTSTTPTWENNKELEAYKKEARKKITQEYVKKVWDEYKENNDKDKCSRFFQYMGNIKRGDRIMFKLIKKYFGSIDSKDCSEIKIRADIEVLFEVLTNVKSYNDARDNEYRIRVHGILNIDFSEVFMANGENQISKCFVEHCILSACALYKNQEWIDNYYKTDFFQVSSHKLKDSDEVKQRPLMHIYDWDKEHKHGSVLKEPSMCTPIQSPSK